MEFRELPLAQALRLLADQTGLNLLCSADAGKTKVSLFLKQVPARVVVAELCKAHNLWYRVDDASGITRIMTLAEFQRTLGEFREEQTAVFTLLYPNAVDVASAIKALYGDRVRLSFGPDQSDDLQDLQDRFNRFDVVDSRSQGLGLFNSNSSGGVTNATYGQNGYSGNSLANTYTGAAMRPAWQPPSQSRGPSQPQSAEPLTPAQAEAISDLLQDKNPSPDQQAALSAWLRRATDIYVTLVRRNNMVIVRTSDQGTMDEIRKLVRQLDVPTPLVLLEIKVLSIQLSDDFSSFFDYQFSAPGPWSPAGSRAATFNRRPRTLFTAALSARPP